jgi:hypothetical protein
MTTWHVGMTVGGETATLSVDTSMLRDNATWEDAVTTCFDMAQVLHPDAELEFNFIKEFDKEFDNV